MTHVFAGAAAADQRLLSRAHVLQTEAQRTDLCTILHVQPDSGGNYEFTYRTPDGRVMTRNLSPTNYLYIKD